MRAAIEVIAEVGIGQVTHRLVAARAQVPLGSTTYYFPTLDDLVADALRELTEIARAGLEEWAEELTASQDPVDALVGLLRSYLDDRDEALIGYELCLAAARAPRLRPVAVLWTEGLRGICARLTGGPASGFALAALVDGASMRALASGEPLDETGFRAGATALISPRKAAGST